MDLAYPSRAVVPTLDGPVLEVLVRTTGPLSGREVHRLTGIGSPAGVRLALARLVRQGLVRIEDRATAAYYLGNRDHIAWPVVEALASLRRSLIGQIENELRRWRLPPVHASLFGSAARGDGDADSDIDILLVRPDGVDEDEPPWAEQVDRLRGLVETWSGNRCQPFQLDEHRLSAHEQAADPLVDAWLQDSVTLAGEELRAVLRRLPESGGVQ